MESVRPETLAFLAPGLLHQFGNILFTIQGNAQVGGAGAGGRELAAILAAAARGGQALRVLRCLLGDPVAMPAEAGELLGQLGDFARVPLREARFALEVRTAAAAAPVFVAATDFCIVVVEALHQLVRAQPHGAAGTIVLDLSEQGPRHATVRLGVQAAAGCLPFPFDTAALLLQCEAACRRPSRPTVRWAGTRLELRFVGQGGPLAAEA